MVQALTLAFNKFCNYTIGIGAFQEFDFGFAFFKKCGVYFFAFHQFCLVALTIQQLFKQRNSFCKFLYCYADVLYFLH